MFLKMLACLLGRGRCVCVFLFTETHYCVKYLAGKWDAAALRAFFSIHNSISHPLLPAGRESVCTVFILF